MGFFSDLWDFIKNAAKKIYKFFSKVFTTVFKGIKFVVECVVNVVTTIKNSWVGTILQALSFIFELLDFFKSKGADVDADEYKREILDMDIRDYGRHRFDIILN